MLYGVLPSCLSDSSAAGYHSSDWLSLMQVNWATLDKSFVSTWLTCALSHCCYAPAHDMFLMLMLYGKLLHTQMQVFC